MRRALLTTSAARILGARGGARATPAQIAAARANAPLGGRPPGTYRDASGAVVDLGDYVHAVEGGWLVAALKGGSWHSPTGRRGYVAGRSPGQLAALAHVYPHRGTAVRAAMRVYGLTRD